MNLSEYVKSIKNHPEFGPSYVFHKYLPPNKALYGKDFDLNPELIGLLQHLGIDKFYQHQIDAIQHIRQGKNVLVATPTASGKSLVYNISVLEALLKNEKAKALLSLKKVEKTIVTEVDDSVRKVNLDKNKAEQRIKIEELQRLKLVEEEKKYKYGRSDSDRIIRFQEDLLHAEILALKAVRDYMRSLVDLYLTEDTYLERRNLTVK